MIASEGRAPAVLRDLHVESAPLRLRARTASRVAPAASAAPPPSEQDEAQRARERGFQEGRQQGLRAGHEEGLRQGRAEAAEEVRRATEQAVTEALLPLRSEQERVRQLGVAVQVALDGVLAAAQEEMIALCYETICRIVGASAVQPDAVRDQLAQLLVQHGGREGVVLHVHPQDARWLAGGAEEAAQPPLCWEADPQVRLGGCILKSRSGGLDARLETMLAECKAALLAARAGGDGARPGAGESR